MPVSINKRSGWRSSVLIPLSEASPAGTQCNHTRWSALRGCFQTVKPCALPQPRLRTSRISSSKVQAEPFRTICGGFTDQVLSWLMILRRGYTPRTENHAVQKITALRGNTTHNTIVNAQKPAGQRPIAGSHRFFNQEDFTGNWRPGADHELRGVNWSRHRTQIERAGLTAVKRCAFV